MYRKETLKQMNLRDIEKERKKSWDYFKLIDLIMEAKKKKVI
jgi:hypothetical protein